MIIESSKGMIKQKEILEVAEMSRQAYHGHFKRKTANSNRDELVLSKVIDARKTMTYRKMGARPLYYALGVKEVGINYFEQLLSKNNLNVVMKKRRIVGTNGKRDADDVNLVKNTSINDINQVMVADITYLPVNGRFYFIFTLKDAYSKRILGLYGNSDMKAVNGVKCLKQAERARDASNLKGCIHHSDAGSQYKSTLYRNTGKYLRWSIAADCLENGMAEQLNFILKDHYLEEEKVNNVYELNRLLSKVKKMINEKRPVQQLGYLTPVEFEEYIKGIPLEKRVSFVFKDPDKKRKWGDFIGGISVKESLLDSTKKQ